MTAKRIFIKLDFDQCAVAPTSRNRVRRSNRNFTLNVTSNSQGLQMVTTRLCVVWSSQQKSSWTGNTNTGILPSIILVLDELIFITGQSSFPETLIYLSQILRSLTRYYSLIYSFKKQKPVSLVCKQYYYFFSRSPCQLKVLLVHVFMLLFTVYLV